MNEPASLRSSCDYIPVGDNVQIFCRLSGLQNRGTPLVLLHGNRDNHSHFAEVEGFLSQSRLTMALDFRGHGLSSKPDCPLSPEGFVKDVQEVVRHFGWEKIILVGHSLGAVTSMVYALNVPGQVERLVLMGASAYYRSEWQRPATPLTAETFPDIIAEANKRAAPFFFLEEYPAVQRRVLASWSAIPLHVHRNLLHLVHPDLREAVPKLPMPALVIAGEKDRCTPVDSARWIKDHLPAGSLAVIPGTGHFMFMEKPQEVARLVEEFLHQP
jgi:pimeloyl-ACP methyl ester carboxylesterase